MKEEFISLPLQLEVPQNDGEFKLGLMFRESLEQDRGMLFIFESNDSLDIPYEKYFHSS